MPKLNNKRFSRRSALASAAALLGLNMLPAFGQAGAGPLRIGVIGAGWLGGTVGRIWVKSGHEVRFASLNLEALRAMTAQLGPRASVGTARQAAEFGSILLFAVPYDALPGLGQELRDAMSGKILLDACNPAVASALAEEARLTSVGALSAKLLPGARLVRAFSAVDATAIEDSAGGNSAKLGVPFAGDDPAALAIAGRLIKDAGCDPVLVGNLAAATAFQRGGPGFRANTTADELRRQLQLAPHS